MKKHALTGLLLLFGLSACASFSYKFYVLNIMSYDGNILRKGETIPFSRCAPNDSDKSPCIVIFREEAYRLKADYESLQIKLDQCQRGN